MVYSEQEKQEIENLFIIAAIIGCVAIFTLFYLFYGMGKVTRPLYQQMIDVWPLKEDVNESVEPIIEVEVFDQPNLANVTDSGAVQGNFTYFKSPQPMDIPEFSVMGICLIITILTAIFIYKYKEG
jgi:hypothetical protein